MKASEIIQYIIWMFASGIAGIILSVIVIGMFGSIWMVIAEKRGIPLNEGEEVTLFKGLARIIKYAPYLIIFHPLPWIILILVRISYLMVTGRLNGIAFWCALSFIMAPIINAFYQIYIRDDDLK